MGADVRGYAVRLPLVRFSDAAYVLVTRAGHVCHRADVATHMGRCPDSPVFQAAAWHHRTYEYATHK